MELKVLYDPFPHFIMENVFDENDQKIIWNELFFLASKMLPAEKTNAAVPFAKRNLAKRGSGIFLESIFKQHDQSDISLLSSKMFTEEIVNKITEKKEEILFRTYRLIKNKSILVQMYKNGDYYDSHSDYSYFTSITCFNKTPKQYTGGDLIFTEYNYMPKLEHNCAIFFPSCLPHCVTEVKMQSNAIEDARFSITQFLFITP